MVAAARWAREQKVPFLGICLGFQVAVIEFARAICGITRKNPPKVDIRIVCPLTTFFCPILEANSAEFEPECPEPVVIYMPEISKTHLGGTMRLGLRQTIFQDGTESSKLKALYGGREVVWERHRHRYEVNPKYVDQIEKQGLRFTRKDEKGERMQIAELQGGCYLASRLSFT